jgi:hypothetical protein
VLVLDLRRIDLEELATALQDQSAYEHRWLINPMTGAIGFWTEELGVDGHTPVDLDELDEIVIEALPPRIWYRDMADFTEAVSDERARERLTRALQGGRGAFRRFNDELHGRHPHLLSAWSAWRDARAKRHAVQWLADRGLVDDGAVKSFLLDLPEPDLP